MPDLVEVGHFDENVLFRHTHSMNDENDEVIIEEEEGTDAEASKVKKLQIKLKECEEKGREYLDGWQRSRADFVNAQKRAEIETRGAKDRGVNEVLERIINVLDSFDSALNQTDMDEKTRKGIVLIHKQTLDILSSYNVVSFSPLGEMFDPMLHDAIAHDAVEEGKEEGAISAVIRSGYKRGEQIIRPATVRVYGS